MAKLLNLITNAKGATAIEYGLIAALIAVAAIAAMGNIGNSLGSTFNNVASKLYSLEQPETAAARKRAAVFFVRYAGVSDSARRSPAGAACGFSAASKCDALSFSLAILSSGRSSMPAISSRARLVARTNSSSLACIATSR